MRAASTTNGAVRVAAGRRDHYPTRNGSAVFIDRHEPTIWSTPGHRGPLDRGELAHYERDGFVSLGGLLTADEVAAYRAELSRLTTDPAVRADERTVVEKGADEVRSIFEVHRLSEVIAALVEDDRVRGPARQILGSEVYVHQSRINYKPGFTGRGFFWHSDFETWHAEDGMPAMRAVSVSISLTENQPHNGSLMIMPGSHRVFVPGTGETPVEHHRESLREQRVGTPPPAALTTLADRFGITAVTGPAGSATIFDCNCMHGSSNNITPYPRSNIFIVYNSVLNTLHEPFAAAAPRPNYLAARRAHHSA